MLPSAGVVMLLGGARSGKSDLSVELGRVYPGAVTVVATATAGDADMASRIERHQRDRPAAWATVEAPTFAAEDASALASDGLVVLDCLTLLVTNLFLGRKSVDTACQGRAVEDEIDAHLRALVTELEQRQGPTLIVTNEVGMGVHPPNALGREFRDLLGRANRTIATRAAMSLLVVAGRAVTLEPAPMQWDTT